MRLRSVLLTVSATALVSVAPVFAQLPSNASLKGAYNVRYVGVNTTTGTDVPVSFFGTFTFDGTGNGSTTPGNFTATGSESTLNGTTTNTQNVSLKGTYTVLSSGMITITNPFDTSGNTTLFGGLGFNSALVASSTDTAFCDLLVAVPAGSNLSTGTLSGNYFIASLEFPNGDFTLTRQTFSSITADGKGGLGSITVKGTALNLNSAATSQTVVGASYTVTGNGTGTLTLPAPNGVQTNQQLLSGTKTLYVSPDGNLFIAGSPGFDMVIGMKAMTGASNASLSGLYFTGELENFQAGNANSNGIYAYQGSSNLLGNTQVELAHLRVNPDGFANFDETFTNGYNVNSDGTINYTGFQYAVGAGGNIELGAGTSNDYLINLYLKLPNLTGANPFLNPSGVVNAASSIPFTAQIAPGEVISLYGSGLAGAPAGAQSLPFPPNLGNVTVTANWNVFSSSGTSTPASAQCPLISVSPTLINAIVPLNAPTDGSYITFTVSNNGQNSNSATFYTGFTSPGVFTCDSSVTSHCVATAGLGTGAILHPPPTYTLVSTAAPAKQGETIQTFLTGLGTVTPPVQAGVAGPTSPFSTVDNPADIYLDDSNGNFFLTTQNPGAGGFAGLAPGLGGLYQINSTIPSNTTTGTLQVEIFTVDADNIEALIPIAAAGSTNSQAAERLGPSVRSRVSPAATRRPKHALGGARPEGRFRQ